MSTPTASCRAISGITIREAPKGSGFIGVLEGHAAVFNSDSLALFENGVDKPFVERISPGAFARTLRETPDILALWSHQYESPIGRTPNTLALHEDSKGLASRVSLIDTTLCRDALASCRAGHVRGWSFGFIARRTRWIRGKDQDVRILDDVDLFEVSPTASPAYPGTDLAASARSSLVVRNGASATDELRALCAERDAFFRNECQRSEITKLALRFL